MDFVRQLLCTGIKDQECNITEEEIPRVGEFFENIELIYLIAICVGSIITIIVFILGIIHWVFVLKFISNEQIRTDLYWLVFMGPVISTCGTIGLVIPRAAIFLYAIALVYFMICIFVLVCLMLTLNGSRQILCEKLILKGVKISLRVCPLGCCLFCLSKVEPNQLNFRRMEWLVFQSPIVRIFLEVVNIIVFMEINSRANLFTQISNVIGMISLFVGSYGSYMIIPAGSSLLGEYRFLLLFRLVDISQLAWSVQKVLFEFLAFPRLHIFSTKSVLPPSAKAQFCISFLLCVEMLIVSLLATFMFKPSRTWFFDKFQHHSISRGCRIADANNNNNNCVNGDLRFLENGIIVERRENLPKINFNESLRLEQVRLNGSGNTIYTETEENEIKKEENKNKIIRRVESCN
ncbi:hypothetical protein ACQ4LE_003581 [Meloidogyne hapla]